MPPWPPVFPLPVTSSSLSSRDEAAFCVESPSVPFAALLCVLQSPSLRLWEVLLVTAKDDEDEDDEEDKYDDDEEDMPTTEVGLVFSVRETDMESEPSELPRDTGKD